MDMAQQFLSLLENGESHFHERRLSDGFERLATRIFHAVRPGYWYDGVAEIRYRRRKEKQFVFTGKMWVAQGPGQWQEDFEARLTDMRSSKQGIRLTMRIGDFTAEGEVAELDHPPL